MVSKYKYRFKTKKEFISEFGEYWRSAVPKKFIENMDFLLGTELKPDDPNITFTNGDFCFDEKFNLITQFELNVPTGVSNYRSRFIISPEMIKKEPIILLYKPRKFIYE